MINEYTRKMTANEQECFDIGYKAGKYDALREQEKYHIGDVNEMIPQWISVEGRLPKPFENVLCFFPYKNYGSQIDVSYFESNSGVCADAHRFNAPSHWMPLPQPPQKGE